MRTRILSLGISATHDLITHLANLSDLTAISDFHAFAFDPLQMQGANPENFARKQGEIRDLLVEKAGIVICLLRQAHDLGFAVAGRRADAYSLLDQAASNVSTLIRSARAGSGSRVEVIATARGASAGYLRVLTTALRFAAYLPTNPANLANIGGTVLAVDSVGHPIGIEFALGAGRICFVPIPDGATGDRVGSAIARVVEAHYGGPSEIEVPAWAVDVDVPGATAHDAVISKLEEDQGRIEREIEQLKQKRVDLLNYRVLLYGYGKSVLEPVVRSALRPLGFVVLEPDEYKGEWDVELHEPRSSFTALAEVEGSEGIINVDKFRQLLNYVQDEALEGRDHKGILIGNGYRLTAPGAAERQKQFSGHALNGANKNEYCLLPTSELFKAVCAVLEAPDDEGLKIGVRDSILSTVGVWSFAREIPRETGQA